MTKTCAKIACKHLVNIQLSDRFLSTLAMKKRFTYDRFTFWQLKQYLSSIENSHSRTSICQNNPPSAASVRRFCSHRLPVSPQSQTGKTTSTKILWYKRTGPILRPSIVYSSWTRTRIQLFIKVDKCVMKVLYSAAWSPTWGVKWLISNLEAMIRSKVVRLNLLQWK